MSGNRRADLLALTPDDLATLTNRGTVKRAQKEIEAGEPSFVVHEEEGGELLFRWSDGITCRFPAGRPVHDAVCSSGLAGISRHIIRSILAYQQAEAERSGSPGSAVPAETITGASPAGSEASHVAQALAVDASPPPVEASAQPGASWDPGTITDDDLISRFRKPAILKARKRFEQGVLVELTRGSKPVARFLDENCTVRFLVPGSLHYISADCAESLLPLWVPIAVWAFRELPPQRLAGLVSLQNAPLPVPKAEFGKLEALLGELCRDGLNGIADSWPQRLSRVEQALRDAGLVWPAELVVDLVHQVEMYRQHDARFEPRQVVQLLGELTARERAILNETRAVPQLLIRGTKSDRPAEIAGSRMIGVGLGVRPGRKQTTVSAYLQDVDSGGVVAVERTFAEPPPGESPRSFAALASSVLTRGVSLASLASSQLLLKSGKRTPSGLLMLPRTTASLATHPQSYQWEQLKPPLATEGFAQLAERFETLPPSCLRPRRRTENLHVVAVERVDMVTFDPTTQRLNARLLDPQGGSATLVQPFHHQGREGFDDLASILETRGDRVRFVSGHVRSRGQTLEIQPIAIVLDDGQRRLGVQPWLPLNLDIAAATEEQRFDEDSPEPMSELGSPVAVFLQRVDDLLSELLLTGLTLTPATAWADLAEVARQLGFVRLAAPIAALAGTLQARADTLRWDVAPALLQFRELCLLSRLASE